MKQLMVILALMGIFSLTACQEEGPAEEAGQMMDDAAESAADTMESAADSVEDAVNDATN